jgi:acetylornithine deacetylase/succinyl-diaminopimelate desuccinylase-like protein
MNNVVDFINTSHDRYLDELKEFLAIPSVSALPEHTADMRRCADWAAGHMRSIGFQAAKVVDTAGHPVVYGEWLGALGAPTILIYGHYDVQPVDPVELWTSPPFEATIRDKQLYARGSADDKGQVFVHFKAIEAHVRQTGRLPVNVKVILEGEEEVGSANLSEYIRQHKSELAANVLVISDTSMFDYGVPSICYGLRGLAYCQIDLRGSKSDLHSGSFGGAVANPAFVLAQVLSQMKDRSGHVKIPGFYDDVRPVTGEELAEFKRLPFSDAQYRKDLEAPRLFGERGYSTLERTWIRPTFEVNGLLSGFTGEGSKTVIPATAMAKISMRLVPDQDPGVLSRRFDETVQARIPETVRVEILDHGACEAYVAPLDGPAMQAAVRALREAFGRDVAFIRSGGSLPILPLFKRVLGADSLLLGFASPSCNAHGPNEKVCLTDLDRGADALVRFLAYLGTGRSTRT